MLNNRNLGQMIKWLAMVAEQGKHNKDLASDADGYDYAVGQVPSGMMNDFKAAYHTCPAEGRDSLKEQTLRHMKKLSIYKPV